VSNLYAILAPSALFARLFSQVWRYGIGIVVARAGWLVVLPLYWIKLEPADFGVIGIVQMLQALLAPALSLGIADSAQRLFLEWPQNERRKNLFTLLFCSVTIGGLLCFFLEWIGPRLFAAIFAQVEFKSYLRFAVWTAFFANIALIPLAMIRLQERVLAFSVITVGSFLTQAAVGLPLVLWYDFGPEGYLFGTLVSTAIWSLVSVAALARDLTLGFSAGALVACLRYGFPTAGALSLESVAGILDRYVLDKVVPLAQIGLYNLASQIGSGFSVFNQAFKASWFPFLYRATVEREDAGRLLAQFAPIYLALLAVPALAIALLAEEFVVVFGGARYEGVYPLVPFFVLYYYQGAVTAALGRGMDLAKRTAPWPLVPAVGLAVTMVALVTLVPRFAVWGAVASLLLGAFSRALVQTWLSLRAFPRPLHLKRLSGVFGAATATFVLGWWLAPDDVIGALVVKTMTISAGTLPLLWLGAGCPSPKRALAEIRAFVGKEQQNHAS
jgi:O-antigen/teichoic acid export membrane protein